MFSFLFLYLLFTFFHVFNFYYYPNSVLLSAGSLASILASFSFAFFLWWSYCSFTGCKDFFCVLFLFLFILVSAPLPLFFSILYNIFATTALFSRFSTFFIYLFFPIHIRCFLQSFSYIFSIFCACNFFCMPSLYLLYSLSYYLLYSPSLLYPPRYRRSSICRFFFLNLLYPPFPFYFFTHA